MYPEIRLLVQDKGYSFSLELLSQVDTPGERLASYSQMLRAKHPYDLKNFKLILASSRLGDLVLVGVEHRAQECASAGERGLV